MRYLADGSCELTELEVKALVGVAHHDAVHKFHRVRFDPRHGEVMATNGWMLTRVVSRELRPDLPSYDVSATRLARHFARRTLVVTPEGAGSAGAALVPMGKALLETLKVDYREVLPTAAEALHPYFQVQPEVVKAIRLVARAAGAVGVAFYRAVCVTHQGADQPMMVLFPAKVVGATAWQLQVMRFDSRDDDFKRRDPWDEFLTVEGSAVAKLEEVLDDAVASVSTGA